MSNQTAGMIRGMRAYESSSWQAAGGDSALDKPAFGSNSAAFQKKREPNKKNAIAFEVNRNTARR